MQTVWQRMSGVCGDPRWIGAGPREHDGTIDKGHLLPQFHSGATGLPDRFSEEFSLRRLEAVLLSLVRAPAPPPRHAYFGS